MSYDGAKVGRFALADINFLPVYISSLGGNVLTGYVSSRVRNELRSSEGAVGWSWIDDYGTVAPCYMELLALLVYSILGHTMTKKGVDYRLGWLKKVGMWH